MFKLVIKSFFKFLFIFSTFYLNVSNIKDYFDIPNRILSKVDLNDIRFNNRNAFSNINVINLAKQEDNFSCGFFALAHAKALNKFFHESIIENRKINYNEFIQFVYVLRDSININNQLSNDDILKFIKDDNFDDNNCNIEVLTDESDEFNFIKLNVYFESLLENSNKFNFNDYLAFQFGRIEEIKDNFRNKSNGILNFICHIPGHWMLISVLKKNNQKPLILIIDSLTFKGNYPINNKKNFIEFIVDNIL